MPTNSQVVLASPREDPESEEGVSGRQVLTQVVVFTLVLVALTVLGGLFLREEIQLAAQWLLDKLGMVGVVAGVFASDTLSFPVPPDVYIFAGVASGSDLTLLLVVCCVSSVVASSVAFFIGPYIERLPFLGRRFAKFRVYGESLFDKYGMWAVSIAALSPLPFAVTSWFAGMCQMRYIKFFVATLVRIPRLLGYYGLFVVGWG